MNKALEIGLIIVATAAIGIADVLLKKNFSSGTGFLHQLKDPLVLTAVGLYLLEVFIFSFLFYSKSELSIVGIVQVAFYSIIVIGSGILFFNEKMTVVHGIGIGFAIVGVTLMNL